MQYPAFRISRGWKAAALLAVIGTAGAFAAALPAGFGLAAPDYSKLSAVYKIRFAGLPLGKFEVWSNYNGSYYSMRGKAELSFLKGIILKIKGGTSSSGALTPASIKPASFAFDFRVKKNRGFMAVQFKGDTVSEVRSEPPLKNHPEAVPLTKEHLTNVLDPLTALFFGTRSKQTGLSPAVCERTVQVFDGKYRFDLQLSHKKTISIVKSRKSGYGGPALVCRVKFIPVAGHRPNTRALSYMTETDEIEAWLIPVPNEPLFVPYYVKLPTPYGTASATSTTFHVEQAGQKKFALVQ